MGAMKNEAIADAEANSLENATNVVRLEEERDHYRDQAQRLSNALTEASAENVTLKRDLAYAAPYIDWSRMAHDKFGSSKLPEPLRQPFEMLMKGYAERNGLPFPMP